MKVIENNNKSASWKIVCTHCNSVLEYLKEDVHHKESYFCDFHYIVCPCCNGVVDVKRW